MIEHELGSGLVFSSSGLGDQRGGADAEHLREREHDHVQISGHAHRRDRFLAKRSNPKHVRQQIERLHYHGHRHERRHVEQVFGD